MNDNKTSGHSVLATTVLTLGVAGLMPGWGLPFAALCFGLGYYELVRIRKSQSPVGGKWMVILGIVLASLGSVFTIFSLLLLNRFRDG